MKHSSTNITAKALAGAAIMASAFGGLFFGHRRAERDLRGREQQLRNLVNNAADAFFIHDEKGKIVDCNRTACESLGYTREELLSCRWTT